ncbi:LPXTG cell wall anchor domain-containing protein, partial [Carnobacterium maltaromaticum]|uniref:LPXTG cell wall anchor domain-containing protein n=1 Tax=Carnobacterium maltaromaticum TaxID=2751 RepID=UPI0039BEA7EE
MMNFFTTYGSDLLLKTGEHIYISAVALGLGILVAVPLGVLLTRTNKIASVVIGIT